MYDSESGYSHMCPNGHMWWDSDGGACCVECGVCNKAMPWEDMPEIDGEYYCSEECAAIARKELAE